MNRTVDTILDAAWSDGLFRGDAAILRGTVAVAPAHARAAELSAFATLAALKAAGSGSRDDLRAWGLGWTSRAVGIGEIGRLSSSALAPANAQSWRRGRPMESALITALYQCQLT